MSQGKHVTTADLVEVSFQDLDDRAAFEVAEVFNRWGWGGAVLEEVIGEGGEVRRVVKTYAPADEADHLRKIEIGLALLNRERATQGQPPIPLPQMRTLAETDWAEAWKAHYHVLRVGRRLVVMPTWETYDAHAGEVVIEMDPGMAFGSGLHATTQLCLQMLEDCLQPGDHVLDVGTGSGILAIAAAKLGAASVLAIDSDPLAVQVALDNVQINGLGQCVSVRLGAVGPSQMPANHLRRADACPEAIPGLSGDMSLHLAPHAGTDSPSDPYRWDIILANLLAETILNAVPELASALSTGGVLIASGIVRERADEVSTGLRGGSLSVVERRVCGDWVALKVQR